MSMTNLKRDAFWIKDILNSSLQSWSSDLAGAMNSDGNVNTDVGSVKTTGFSAVTTYHNAVGLFMKPPLDDNEPYRVKGYVENVASGRTFLIVAYAPSVITGTDDILEDINYFRIEDKFDEVIMLPAHETSHSKYNRPIAFGIATYATGVTSVQLSVQKLGTAPPAMALGVG